MRYKTGDPKKYCNDSYSLDMSATTRELLYQDNAEFRKCCNGVGSTGGSWWAALLYHITPNTIWGMDITPASDGHDVDYSHPTSIAPLSDAELQAFQAQPNAWPEWIKAEERTAATAAYVVAWRAANDRFVGNCRKLAFARGGWLLLPRLARVDKYGLALGTQSAWRSFMAARQSVAARRFRERRMRP